MRWHPPSGVSEVASIGGFVQEYQIDVDPDAMRAFGVSLEQVFQGVRMSNVDVGARTIELNRAEYVIRGLGFFEILSDIEKVVLKVKDDVPVTIKDVANVSLGTGLAAWCIGQRWCGSCRRRGRGSLRLQPVASD